MLQAPFENTTNAAGWEWGEPQGPPAAIWSQARQALGLHEGGPVNKAVVCLDRHPPAVQARTALIWQATDGEVRRYTFADLVRRSNQVANVLVQQGIQPGDRVFLFLERVPELYYGILGALKAGAIAGPLFSAFGPEAVRDRLQDSGAKILITSLALLERVEAIRHELPALERILLVDRHHDRAQPLHRHEFSLEALMSEVPDTFTPVATQANSPSVMHYTSGTTGKPKGAVHTHGAVVLQAATARMVLDLRPEQGDIYWCTADPGWVTGTAYGIFGPWALGCPLVVYEGPFSAEGWYRCLQTHGVTNWYTAPTAIRMLMKAGDEAPKLFDLSRLRHLGSVGEPLNPEALAWGERAFGLSFHDTWWQTETGGIHITNRPGLPIRPGSMGKPFPGVTAGILDDAFQPLPPGEEGHLALRPDTPGIFKTYWGREDLFASRFKNGWYITGDRARQDADGYFWFIGRADDVINTAGHLVGPFEVESALIEHPAVAEAAVIGKPDPERLEVVKAFVSLKVGFEPSDALKHEIQNFVRTRLAAHAYPRELDFLPSLPKTRSGKILRRLLKARELGLPEGDLSTLED